MKAKKPGFLKRVLTSWSSSSYPFPPGSQNNDGFERNADNPLSGYLRDDMILRLSAVWACVRLIAETISTLPLNVYERKPDGTRAFAGNHWLYELLHSQPNAKMTAQTFWEAYVASMLLWGNAYGEKQRLGNRVVAIDFLIPSRVSWTRNTDGSLTFRYTENGQQRQIKEADMFHTLGFTTDGQMGLSVVCYGVQVFSSALSADRAANSTFDKGLMPTVGFSMQQILKKEQRTEFRDNFKKEMSGSMNAGKPFLLEGGMKAEQIGIDPVDAQLLESRAWSVEEICRWFRVPPFMVGHSEKSTSWGTGIEQQMIGFVAFGLRPWLTRIEQSIRKNLLSAEKNRYFAEFAIEGLLRADSQARAALYASAGQNGWMTRNEMRELENLPPVEGGDVLTVQSNLIPIDKLGQATAATTAADALKNFLGLDEKDQPCASNPQQ